MLSWPDNENPVFTLDVEIDERTIEHYPFETTDEMIVGAIAHTMTAHNALALADEIEDSLPDYPIATLSVAFWHACQAKHCLFYADSCESDSPLPPIAEETLRDANEVIAQVMEHAAPHIPEFLDIDTVAISLANARARLKTVQGLTAKLDQFHPIEDQASRRALIRMTAYMGNLDTEAIPPSSITHSANRR